MVVMGLDRIQAPATPARLTASNEHRQHGGSPVEFMAARCHGGGPAPRVGVQREVLVFADCRA
jgi:hypothetical protein